MISIVIPVFNEENNIGKLLEHLFDNSSSKNISEILVVDGGSTDSSQQIIKKVISVISSAVERCFKILTRDLKHLKIEKQQLMN